MAFATDHGGLAFSCEDAKLAHRASTWNTKLSQIGRVAGPIYVLTRNLRDVEYIRKIISKRPRELWLIAHEEARREANDLKMMFPSIRLALHPSSNIKAALVFPNTVWVSTSDFGKSSDEELAIGMHSEAVFNEIVDKIFRKLWSEAVELN